MYRAVLKSGDHVARRGFEQTINREVQFDFDSNQGDVSEGATPIGAQFIVNGKGRAYLVATNFQRVTPVVDATCRMRRRAGAAPRDTPPPFLTEPPA